MTDTQNTEQEIQQEIVQVDLALRQSLTVFLEAGYSPGAIAGGFMIAIYRLMKAQEMSEMEISNELYELVDGVRESAFDNTKAN